MRHDRDPLFSAAFGEALAAADVHTVRLPPRSPNLNPYAERFVRTIKESCLNRLILVGERSLRRAVAEFVTHYHHERNHQGRTMSIVWFARPHDTETAACIIFCGAQPRRKLKYVSGHNQK